MAQATGTPKESPKAPPAALSSPKASPKQPLAQAVSTPKESPKAPSAAVSAPKESPKQQPVGTPKESPKALPAAVSSPMASPKQQPARAVGTPKESPKAPSAAVSAPKESAKQQPAQAVAGTPKESPKQPAASTPKESPKAPPPAGTPKLEASPKLHQPKESPKPQSTPKASPKPQQAAIGTPKESPKPQLPKESPKAPSAADAPEELPPTPVAGTFKTGTPKVGTPHTPTAVTTQMPKAGTPHTPKSGTPHTPTAGTPHTPKAGTPHTHTAGTPHTPTAVTTQMPKAGTPHTPKSGTPHTPTAATPQMPKAGTPHTGTPKQHTPKNSAHHTPHTRTPHAHTPKEQQAADTELKVATPKAATPKTGTPKEHTPKQSPKQPFSAKSSYKSASPHKPVSQPATPQSGKKERPPSPGLIVSAKRPHDGVVDLCDTYRVKKIKMGLDGCDTDLVATCNSQPPTVLVIGKPFSGKTEMATRLARALKAVYIDVAALLKLAIKGDELFGIGKQIADYLEAGNVVDNKSVMRILEAVVHTDEAEFQGYVLDLSTMNASLLEDMKRWKNFPKYLVEVCLSGKDIVARATGAKWDPRTGKIFTAKEAQALVEDEEDIIESEILSSRSRTSATTTTTTTITASESVEGTATTQASDALERDTTLSWDADPDDDDEAAIAADDGASSADEADAAAALADAQNPALIFDRLLLMPEYTDAQALDLLSRQQPVGFGDADLSSNGDATYRRADLLACFPRKRALRVCGYQQPRDMVLQVLRSIQPAIVVAPPFRLSPPPSSGSDQDGVKFLLANELQDDTGSRRMSPWGVYCPVSLMSGVLQKGSPEFAVSYLNRLFLCASSENQDSFIVNPKKYLREPPPLPTNARVAVLGPPLSGKTTISQRIADWLQIPVIGADELVNAAAAESNSPTQQQVADTISAGGLVTDELYSALFAEAVQKRTEVDAHHGRLFGLGGGCVFDGFPQTGQQLRGLREAGVQPDVVILLVEDEESELARRKKNLQVDDGLDEYCYRDRGKQYHDNLDALKNAFRQLQQQYHEVPCSGSTEDVFGLAKLVLAPFSYMPEEFEEAGAVSELDNIPGETGRYCPVCLGCDSCLVPGVSGTTVKFKGRVYEFCSDKHVDNFGCNPDYYLSRCVIPPPRIWVIGPKGAGKTTFGKQLATKYNLTYLDGAAILAQADASEKAAMLKSKSQTAIELINAEHVRDAFVQLQTQDLQHGSVLDGLPANAVQLQLFLRAKQYPDAIVVLKPSLDKVQTRISVKPREEEVIATMKELREENDEFEGLTVEDIVSSVTGAPIIAAADAPAAADASTGEDSTPLTAERRAEVLQILRQTAETTLAAAQQDTIERRYNEEIAGVDGVQQVVDDLKLAWVEVDADAKPADVWAALLKGLAPFLELRQNLLSHCVELSPSAANALLASGCFSLSQFGKVCPVAYFAHKELSYPLPGEPNMYPLLLQNHVYFCSSEDNRQAFMTEPLKYVAQRNAWTSRVSVLCSVVGPPASGRSTLAKRLEQELKLVRLTVAKILRRVVALNNTLGQQIDKIMRAGDCVSGLLVTQAVEIVLNSFECINKGVVLDGFPCTVAEALQLQDYGIVPEMVFSLHVPELELLTRAARRRVTEMESSRELPGHNSDSLLLSRYKVYTNHNDGVESYYRMSYSNLYVVDAFKSKWWIYNSSIDIVKRNLYMRVLHTRALDEGGAARVGLLKLEPQRIEGSLSALRRYCPVSLSRGELVLGSPGDKSFLVEYKSLFYQLAGTDEVDAFLREPEHYVSMALPADLPSRAGPLKAPPPPDEIAFQGYCPVTFTEHDNGDPERLVLGDPALAVLYQAKFYFFASENKLRAFLRTPAEYTRRQLPKKLPPRPDYDGGPADVSLLPLPGYVEQSVGAVLAPALAALVQLRPVLPYTSARGSALKFLALHLRAHNPQLTPYASGESCHVLDELVRQCRLVPDILARLNTAASTIDSGRLPTGATKGTNKEDDRFYATVAVWESQADATLTQQGEQLDALAPHAAV
eukprot:TRINITY_DN933_c0_g1_i2.p1 TRINITY_DN933_c0_g1~~TRINITY_DN933_c0_g1_i2.p1  ORF type:complete len:2133 (+),score=547.09 TRINITY_DN933_c0_g1_i2:344-6400(+)